jgi:hypothetical protein
VSLVALEAEAVSCENADCLQAVRQAAYFCRVLGEQRIELVERLSQHHAVLAKCERSGHPSGVRRRRRTVRTLEAELCTLDRLIAKLQRQLGKSVGVDDRRLKPPDKYETSIETDI